MTKEYYVEVKQIIKVKADLSNFTDKFMRQFRDNMYNFVTIEDHINHLAYLYATGVTTMRGNYVDGYGTLEEIEFNLMDYDTKIIDEKEENETSDINSHLL